MPTEENRLIFVAGVPRSGTTLVQNILDSHPDIYGGPEFDRIPNIIDLRRKLNVSIKQGRIDMFVNPAEVDNHIANLIKNLLFPVARRHNCTYTSEKTPWNILAFRDLIEILPEAKFIYVIRYPHAVIASMLKVAQRSKLQGVMPPDFTRSISLACYYIESVLRLVKALDSKYPQKIYTLKYEDLLENPETEIKKLCAYIGVTFADAMLTPGNIKHPGHENMTQTGIWYNDTLYNSNFDKQHQDKWKSQLSGAAKAFINYVFIHNPHIKTYGYSFSNKSMSRLNRWLGKRKYEAYLKAHDFTRMPFRTLGGVEAGTEVAGEIRFNRFNSHENPGTHEPGAASAPPPGESKKTESNTSQVDAAWKRLQENGNLILELGAGDTQRGAGFITLDNTLTCDIRHDLRKPLPFPDNSFLDIYCSHVLEHFYYPELMQLLREVYRILKEGGKLRVCVPDASIYINAYSRPETFDADFFCRYKPAYHYFSKIDHINYIAYMDGHHKMMFDEENLPAVLSSVGFVNVRKRPFDPEVDSEKRDYESIYFVGEKGKC